MLFSSNQSNKIRERAERQREWINTYPEVNSNWKQEASHQVDAGEAAMLAVEADKATQRTYSRRKMGAVVAVAAVALTAGSAAGVQGAAPEGRGVAVAAVAPSAAEHGDRSYEAKHRHAVRPVQLTECVYKLPDNSYWGKAENDVSEVVGRHRKPPVAAVNVAMVLAADSNETKSPDPDHITYSEGDCIKVPTKRVVRALTEAVENPTSNPQLAGCVDEINRLTLAAAMAADPTLDAIRANLQRQLQQPQPEYQARHSAQ